MGFSDLAGPVLRLELVGAAGVAKLHERLTIPAAWRAAGCDEEPSLERVKKKLFEYRSLVAWELHPTAATGQLGYCGIVSYSGPPYVWVDLFLGPPPVELVREVTALLVAAFFEARVGDRLFVHLPREQDEGGREWLLEAGFTPVEQVVYQDPVETASYLIDRNAYEAYYESGGEGGPAVP